MGECHPTPRSGGSRRQGMIKPDEVEAMLGLYELGWGTKRIARESGAAATRRGATWKRKAGWCTAGRGGPASWRVWTRGSRNCGASIRMRTMLPHLKMLPSACAVASRECSRIGC